MPNLRANFCDVFFDRKKAGTLIRTQSGITFRYDSDYLKSDNPFPISYSLPLSNEEYHSQKLHPFFDGVCAQGWYRQAQKTMDNLDKDDSFSTLAINGLDLVGAVEVIGKDLIIPNKPKFDLDREIDTYSLGKEVCLVCLKESTKDYHKECLKNFFGSNNEPKTALENEDFNVRAYSAVHRSSISGFQVKIAVDCNDDEIQAKNIGAKYILKPAIKNMPSSCVNEHLSMKISELILGKGKVAECALIKLNDGQLAYITKRFDRSLRGKVHMEDLSQLLNLEQFSGNYEDAGMKIQECCSGNKVALIEFAQALMVQFYLGNSDYHLKNIGLLDICESGHYSRLSPLYDSLSEEALLFDAKGIKSEMALEFFNDGFETSIYLNDGHSSYLTFQELYKRFSIPEKVLKRHLNLIKKNHEKSLSLIEISFLEDKEKSDYRAVLNDRLRKLQKGQA